MLPHCARLHGILDVSRFKQPARRRVKLELAHVERFITAALAANRISLALETAIQFETTLRQKDVIVEWEPTIGTVGSILSKNARLINGLTWANVSRELEIRKETTRTGAIAANDLKLCPLVKALIARIPQPEHIGPLIMDEKSGRPYARDEYAREWRVIASAAGISKSIKNMDARDGGISEADDAEADTDQIRSAAAHSQASKTARYIRGTIGKSRQVATLRSAHRTAKNVS